MGPKKKGKPPPKKGKGKKGKGPTEEELEEERRKAEEARLAPVKKYLAEMIDTSVSTAVSTSIENHARHLSHQVAAATYVFMVDKIMGCVPPTLTRDDGDLQEYTDSMGFEEEPKPSTIDRMATHVVRTKSDLSDFLSESRKTASHAPLLSQKTMKFAKPSKNMWGADGPAAFGYRSLSNDPRADVPRLTELFDYVDLNGSGDISLDEMQWFLEMQGQTMKRTEFQQAVEALGIDGANAPLTMHKFVEFLLMKLESDPACSFEVRASEKLPLDPVRIADTKILKKLLLSEQEERERAMNMKKMARKNSTWRGGGKSSSSMKTEFIMKSWEELERLRQTLPDWRCLQLQSVKDYDPEAEAMKKTASAKNLKKKKGRGKKRPKTAPSGVSARVSDLDGAGESNNKGDVGGDDSVFNKYYAMAPTLQRPLTAREDIEVREGVTIKEQMAGRPSTATMRSGGDWPYDSDHMTHEQWEQYKNPTKVVDDDVGGENDEIRRALNTKSQASSSAAVSVSPSAQILRGDSEEDDEVASLNLAGARKSTGSPQLPSPNPMSTSPALLKRAEEEARKEWKASEKVKKTTQLIELKEKELLKEISTGGSVSPSLGKLPSPFVRRNRDAFKRMASLTAPRVRPKSATGQSNGSRAALRFKRAKEFEKILGRPSTASKIEERGERGG